MGFTKSLNITPKALFRLTSLTIAIVVGGMSGYGQSSPYTLGTLGLLQSEGFTQHQLMGGLSSSLADEGDFTLVNPASLASLKYTSLQTGSYFNFIEQESATKRRTDRDGDFGGLALAFPISLKHNLGFGAGLTRYTDLNYLIINETEEYGNDVRNVFAGNGGINQFSFGLGYQPIKGLSIGLRAGFLSGSIETSEDKQFPDNKNVFSVRKIYTDYFSGVKYTVGVQYGRQDSTGRFFRIGVNGSPLTNANVGRDEIVTTYNAAGNYFIDTLSRREDGGYEQSLPMEYRASLSVGKKDIWLIGFEYNHQAWSEVSRESSANFFDAQSFTIGGYWQLKSERKTQMTSFSERAKDYLARTRIYYGVQQRNLYTGVVNQKVMETKLSLGLGLPLTRFYRTEGVKKSFVSRINVGAEYTMRGSTDPGMIQENILGIKLGLTFNDKWFNKRKYR